MASRMSWAWPCHPLAMRGRQWSRRCCGSRWSPIPTPSSSRCSSTTPAGDGTLWGNGTLDPYPARQWQLDESIISRIPIATDSTALPQSYRLTLGMGPSRPGAPQATAVWQGSRQQRIPVGSISLNPGISDSATAELPRDMRALDGSHFVGGGLELIAARPLPEEAAIGGPLRIGLLWRAVQDNPKATQFTVRLLSARGEVVQETVMPVLGGRVQPSALHANNVVRDEQSLVVGSRVPTESVRLEVSMQDATASLGSIKMTGRAHVFDTGDTASLGTFGERHRAAVREHRAASGEAGRQSQDQAPLARRAGDHPGVQGVRPRARSEPEQRRSAEGCGAPGRARADDRLGSRRTGRGPV